MHPILWDLGDVLPHAGRIFDLTDYDDKVRGFVEYLISTRPESMSAFYGEINAAFDYFDDNDSSYWNGHHQATIAKVCNCSTAAELVRGPPGERPGGPRTLQRGGHLHRYHEMRVVDPSPGSPGCRRTLVVTKVIKSICRRRPS